MMRKIQNDLLCEGKNAFRENGCLVYKTEGATITASYKEVDYAHILIECELDWENYLDDIEDILDRIETHSLGKLLTRIYKCDGDTKELVDQRHYHSNWHM